MDVNPELRSALRRYQVIAWIVGVLLIVLVFVAVPLRYIGGEPGLSAIVSPIHGFGYMVYLVLAFDLARRAGWALWPRMVCLLLAGTIPVVSFVAERWVRRTLAAEAARSTEMTTAEPVR
ncbi:integral membrane protein [Stackebrandtia albiflava]|uniref:Integral membrane protein n=1 Tax=Stackebrandtia albiflava TaxID=406432 RepID=A0A562VBN1_9ACTN|nr:DUF3817 domain-containing protein [Stackebrandtia albiflava]TWJ15262.1 integral membrane protein [Stackebrandtia albiflava]